METLDLLALWCQRQEAAYAERALKLSGIVAYKEERDAALTVSKTFTSVLEKIDELDPQPAPRTEGMAAAVKRLFFG